MNSSGNLKTGTSISEITSFNSVSPVSRKKNACVDSVEVIDIKFCALDDLEMKMHVSPEMFTPWFVWLADRLGLFADGFPYNSLMAHNRVECSTLFVAISSTTSDGAAHRARDKYSCLAIYHKNLTN